MAAEWVHLLRSMTTRFTEHQQRAMLHRHRAAFWNLPTSALEAAPSPMTRVRMNSVGDNYSDPGVADHYQRALDDDRGIIFILEDHFESGSMLQSPRWCHDGCYAVTQVFS